ncbi:MAG: FecR domain-containing protein [Cyclobacteriaceae bacterium]|nr:FecR domain-containing protein [Cyclobacteriaceae bacterium SS2]
MSRNLTKNQLSTLAEKVLKGTATLEEQQILNDWFHGFEDEEVEILSFDDKEEVHHRILEKINSGLSRATSKSPGYSFWRIAATISLLLASLALFFFYSDFTQESAQVEALPELVLIRKEAEYGQKKLIRLPDSSVVKLNSGSSIQYYDHFSDGRRSLHLSGEAFFDITRDESRPFIIQTDHLEVQVLGTSFNIKSYEEDTHTDVAVKTGRVLVKKLTSSDVLNLNPLEMAVFHNASADLIKQKITNEEGVFGWVQGNLVFDNENFDTVVKMISRWYDVEIDVANTLRKDKNITAKLTNSTLKEALEGLSHTYQFKYEIDGKRITIK